MFFQVHRLPGGTLFDFLLHLDVEGRIVGGDLVEQEANLKCDRPNPGMLKYCIEFSERLPRKILTLRKKFLLLTVARVMAIR